MQPLRSLLNRRENAAIVLVGMLLVGLIAFLLREYYLTQTELRRAYLTHLKHDLETTAQSLSHFYLERKNDLDNLVVAGPVAAFFENKALGVQTEYDLAAGLLGVSERFTRVMEQKRLNGERIFTRITLVDNQGRVLASSPPSPVNEPAAPDWSTFIDPSASHTEMRIELRGEGDEVAISAPCFLKESYQGQIIAKISQETVYRHVVAPDGGLYERAVVIDCGEGHYYLPETLQPTPYLPPLPDLDRMRAGEQYLFNAPDASGAETDVVGIWIPVKETPFSLIEFAPALKIFGQTAPWHPVLLMGLLSLFVLGGTATLLAFSMRNMILRARFEEEEKSKAEVDRKNEQLSREITERKRAEEEVKRQRDRLDALVTERTAELQEANDSLEQDILARERIEEALRESGNKMMSIFRAAPIGIGVVANRVLLDANERLCEITGYSRAELIGNNARILYPTDEDYDYVGREKYRQIEQRGTGTVETRFKRKDGEIIDVLLSSTPLDPNDLAAGVTFTALDITAGKRAEEALRESEERYRSFVQNFQGIAFRGRMDFTPIFFHGAVEEITGYGEREFVVGKPTWDEIIHPEDRAVFRTEDENRLRTVPGYSYEREYRIVRKDGTIRWVHEVIQNVCDDSGQPAMVQGAILDITERKQMEEEVIRIQKIESIGILAGGIAHDFNNILTAILGNISLAKIFAQSDNRILKGLNKAEEASLRARDLTQQLLTFSKGGAPIRKSVSVAKLLRDTTAFTLSGSDIKCEFSLSDGLWPAEIDEGQITQVVNNVVLNARQAMPKGGTIRVSAENHTFVSVPQDLPLEEGRYVKISIEDNGVGIPESDLSKIFDAYFTTKEKGAGLGLSISYSIVKKHGGYINVKSKQGAGTTFCIYLPASKDRETVEPETAPERFERAIKVLVMDDEPLIRDTALAMLEHLGCEAEAAADGTEAIERYGRARNAGRPFDVVILDLTVPGGMGGKEAITKLQEIDPAVRGIVSSGYANDPVMAYFADFGFCGVVTKPYSMGKLAGALRKTVSDQTEETAESK
jgi:PAS domain S-box-containing protein